MRRTSFLVAALLVVALPCLASGEMVRLPTGETLAVVHPAENGLTPARPLNHLNHPPGYPVSALGLGEDSRVLLSALVRGDGSVAKAEVLEAQHPGLGFEEAALTAVEGWTFRPATLGHRAVNSYAFLEIAFREPSEELVAAFAAAGSVRPPTPPDFGVPRGIRGQAGAVLPTAIDEGPARLPVGIEIPKVGEKELYYRRFETTNRGLTPLPSTDPQPRKGIIRD